MHIRPNRVGGATATIPRVEGYFGICCSIKAKKVSITKKCNFEICILASFCFEVNNSILNKMLYMFHMRHADVTIIATSATVLVSLGVHRRFR